MTVPAADKLREAHICPDPEGERRRWIAADLLDALDDLHQPEMDNERGGPMRPMCLTCHVDAPCPTARLLHPEAGES